MIERALVDAAARLRQRSEPFLVATVVAVRGSPYRRPGARMIITADRWFSGSVGGGCIEAELVRRAWWQARDGQPVLVSYDASSTDDTLSLGSGGSVEILLEPPGAVAVDAFDFHAACMRAQTRGALATVFRTNAPHVPVGTRLAFGPGADVSIVPKLRAAIEADVRCAIADGTPTAQRYACGKGAVEILIEPAVPPPRLFLAGAGHDALPVATLARAIGWEVVVWETRAHPGARQRFAGVADELAAGEPRELAARVDACDRALALVFEHPGDEERAFLEALLRTRAAYVGLLGPRQRAASVLASLGRANAFADHRVHAPAGLALGSETPAEIPLAIVAEMKATLARGQMPQRPSLAVGP